MTEEDPIEEIEKTADEKAKKPRKRAAPRKVPEGKKKVKKTDVKAPEESVEKIVQKTILVNFWRTRLHDEELGIHQQLKYQAKTRWYSKNFDMEGEISVDGEKKYIIAYNKEDWHEKPIEERRLVCRYFTIMEESIESLPKGGNFKGGVELSVAHSLIQSYEIRHPAPVFFFQVPGIIYLVRLVRSWRWVGTRWNFALIPEDKDDEFQVVTARGVVGPGRNYKIRIGKKLIARIDGHPIQKEFKIEIYDKEYAKDSTFVKYLTLFGMACNFMKDAIKQVKRLHKKMKSTGSSTYKPPRTELTLFRNPRMMRR